MQAEGGELQSALQYQVLSTGLQHGHLVMVVMMVRGVQHQQSSTLPQGKQVSAYLNFDACVRSMVRWTLYNNTIIYSNVIYKFADHALSILQDHHPHKCSMLKGY